VNNLPKVVTQRCLEQDLNPRPTDRKPICLTVAPPRHLLIPTGIRRQKREAGARPRDNLLNTNKRQSAQ